MSSRIPEESLLCRLHCLLQIFAVPTKDPTFCHLTSRKMVLVGLPATKENSIAQADFSPLDGRAKISCAHVLRFLRSSKDVVRKQRSQIVFIVMRIGATADGTVQPQSKGKGIHFPCAFFLANDVSVRSCL